MRTAGALLIAGFTVFAAGALLPPSRVFTGSEDEQRQIIAAHPARWVGSAVAIAAGVVVTLAGLALLVPVLVSRGSPTWSILAAVGFGLAAALWLVELTFRATVHVAMARTNADPPEWFDALRAWAGGAYRGYMVLAYLSIASLGAALLDSGITASALGWIAAGFGVVGTVVYVAGRPRVAWTFFDIPGVLYLVTAAIGVGLLVGP